MLILKCPSFDIHEFSTLFFPLILLRRENERAAGWGSLFAKVKMSQSFVFLQDAHGNKAVHIVVTAGKSTQDKLLISKTSLPIKFPNNNMCYMNKTLFLFYCRTDCIDVLLLFPVFNRKVVPKEEFLPLIKTGFPFRLCYLPQADEQKVVEYRRDTPMI